MPTGMDPRERAHHRAAQRRQRRRAGIGRPARRDPRLTLEALRVAGAFDTLTAAAESIGLSGSSGMYAKEHGLTLWAADRAAVRIGCHPADVWGQAWWDVNAERDRELAESGEQLELEVVA